MSTWDDLFSQRRWRVLTEANGRLSWPSPEEPVAIRCTGGHFEIEGPGLFQSPLSPNKGKRGVLLQEVSDGKDVAGSVIPVGEKAILKVREAGALL